MYFYHSIMEKATKIPKSLSRIEQLENDLHRNKLQMNSLLAITQAINNNVTEDGLFKMYESFVTWDLGVNRLALFVYQEAEQKIVVSKGVNTELINDKLGVFTQNFKEPTKIKKGQHPFLDQFTFAIPVRHKNQPIACAFLGGMDEKNLYDQIQVITAVTNFLSVAIENKRLFREKIKQEVIQKEFELASEIQQMLLPRSLPTKDSFELAKIYRQHSQVGGDYYDYFHLDKNRFAFCIADVAGKGISAALLMANFQAILKGLIFRNSTLKDLIINLNEAIFKVTKGERFVTFFIGIINLQSKSLTYVNAGHIPPIMVDNDGVSTLRKGCLILGATGTLPSIEIGFEHFDTPSTIFSFTDGVTDLVNAKNEYLTENKLIAFSKEHFRLSAESFNEALYRFVLDFKGEKSFPDDFTVLTCKIKT